MTTDTWLVIPALFLALAPAVASAQKPIPGTAAADTPEEPPREGGYSAVTIELESLRLPDLRVDMRESDRGTAFLDATAVTGGVAMAIGYRPLRWLIAPELRLSVAGTRRDSFPVQAQGAPDVDLRSTSVILARVEVLAGFAPYLGRNVQVLMLAHVARTMALVGLQACGDGGCVLDDQVRRGSWEIGGRFGVAVKVGAAVRLTATYRTAWGADLRSRGIGVGLIFGEP